jgi:hypothetical protein
MAWPSGTAGTANIDASTDSPAAARADLKDALDKLNLIIGHVTAFAQGLLDDATAGTARTTLGAVGAGAVTSGDLTMSTARVLLRTTAGPGPIEEGTAAQLAAFIAAATEGAQGAVELASSAEAVTGTDLTRAMHPAGDKAALDARLSSTTPSTTGTAAIGTATTFARADHNHAQGAPTSAQVGTATAGLAYGAVGTYFRSSGGGGTWTGNTASGSTNAINTLSGTWRNMTDTTEIAGTGASLALRIA